MTRRDISIGDEPAAFVRTTDLDIWNRFAAVNDEFVPIHMDDEAGKRMGFPGAIGMGALLWSYVHNLLREWLGSDGRIERVSVRYLAPNFRNSTVTVSAKVTEIEETADGSRATLELKVADGENRQLMRGEAKTCLKR